jgi:hypothetical protein
VPLPHDGRCPRKRGETTHVPTRVPKLQIVAARITEAPGLHSHNVPERCLCAQCYIFPHFGHTGRFIAVSQQSGHCPSHPLPQRGGPSIHKIRRFTGSPRNCQRTRRCHTTRCHSRAGRSTAEGRGR